jgi:hypothetical protein
VIRRYQTRPVEVSAVQWDGNNLSEVHDLAGSHFEYRPEPAAEDVAFIRLSPTSWASLGEDRWVVRDDAGALHVHSPAEFAARYEEADETAYGAAETLARFRRFLDEDFRFWCSPNAIAARYADDLLRILDQGGSNGR